MFVVGSYVGCAVSVVLLVVGGLVVGCGLNTVVDGDLVAKLKMLITGALVGIVVCSSPTVGLSDWVGES